MHQLIQQSNQPKLQQTDRVADVPIKENIIKRCIAQVRIRFAIRIATLIALVFAITAEI